MGHVVGANALAWILVTPLAGALADILSWRAVVAFCVLASARAAPGKRAAATGGVGLRGVLADPPARHWILAETISFFAWAASLTFIGAFFVQRHGVGESAAGILPAFGAGAYFLASIHSASLARRLPRREPNATTALGAGVFIVLQFNADPALWVTVMLFCIGAICAGIGTPVSGALGLSQLPDQPGSVMAARTAATQMGYLLGGAVLAWSGYEALGLGAGMVLAAALILRVTDPPAREVAD